MKILISLAVIGSLFTFSACTQKTEEVTETDDVTAVIEAAEGDVITGEALMGDYVKLLCNKYGECGIKAFTDDSDCRNRLTAVLSQDANWAQLQLDKVGLKTCLSDFKGLGCDDFKAGKTPESCTKL